METIAFAKRGGSAAAAESAATRSSNTPTAVGPEPVISARVAPNRFEIDRIASFLRTLTGTYRGTSLAAVP